jgi:hypothetical protein
MPPTSRERQPETTLNGDSLHEPLDSLSIELSRISAEIQSINSGFQAGMQQAIIDARAVIESQYKERFRISLDEAREKLRAEIKEEFRQNFEIELKARVARLGEAQAEIELVTARLEGISREIATMLDDPSIELSRVMRKRTELTELKAYLNGLRFSIGE